MTARRDDLFGEPLHPLDGGNGNGQPAAAPVRAAVAAPVAPAEDAPTQQLGLASVGDRCVVCAAPLTSDQRYCVNCGERRSKPRFTVAEAPDATAAAAVTPASPRAGRGPSSATFVAGVATLLLAMGVGVLIGHDTASSKAAAPGTVKVDVGGTGAAGSGAAAATTPSSTGSSNSNSTSGGKGGAKSSTKAAKSSSSVSSATARKAAAAAQKVTGGSARNQAAPTATVGSSCTGGAGCQGGKFTGNFFGN